MPKLHPAQRDLVTKNVPLARYLARRIWEKNPQGIDIEEITSLAYLGLIAAAQRWDPERDDINPEDIANGKAFSGYARYRIIGSIRDWQRKQDHVQRATRTAYKQMNELGLHNDRDFQRLSEEMDLTEAEVRRIVRTVETPPLSLEGMTPNTDIVDPSPFEVSAPVDVESETFVRHLQQTLKDSYDNLDDTSKIVVAFRYYKQWSLKDIASELDMSASTVGAIHAEALLHLFDSLQSEAEKSKE